MKLLEQMSGLFNQKRKIGNEATQRLEELGRGQQQAKRAHEQRTHRTILPLVLASIRHNRDDENKRKKVVQYPTESDMQFFDNPELLDWVNEGIATYFSAITNKGKSRVTRRHLDFTREAHYAVNRHGYLPESFSSYYVVSTDFTLSEVQAAVLSYNSLIRGRRQNNRFPDDEETKLPSERWTALLKKLT